MLVCVFLEWSSWTVCALAVEVEVAWQQAWELDPLGPSPHPQLRLLPAAPRGHCGTPLAMPSLCRRALLPRACALVSSFLAFLHPPPLLAMAGPFLQIDCVCQVITWRQPGNAWLSSLTLSTSFSTNWLRLQRPFSVEH